MKIFDKLFPKIDDKYKVSRENTTLLVSTIIFMQEKGFRHRLRQLVTEWVDENRTHCSWRKDINVKEKNHVH